MKSDDKFKTFVGDHDLETTSNGSIVDLKYIGKFKVFSHKPNVFINVHDVNNPGNMKSLSRNENGKGLFGFLRRIFKSQTKIADESYKEDILESMNDSRENVKGALFIAQNLARGAEYDENN